MFGHPFQDEDDKDFGETGSALTGSCLTDTFSATSASISSSPPTICGSAKGEHSKWDVELLKHYCYRVKYIIVNLTISIIVMAIRKFYIENNL